MTTPSLLLRGTQHPYKPKHGDIEEVEADVEPEGPVVTQPPTQVASEAPSLDVEQVLEEVIGMVDLVLYHHPQTTV